MKKQMNYEPCLLQDHDEEFLNMVCIDEQCDKRALLCVNCLDDHQKCIKHPVRKFLLEFRQQLIALNQEPQGPKLEDLLQYYESIRGTLEQSQKLINEIFEKTKQTILETKKQIQQMSLQDNAKQLQKQKLEDFEQAKSQDNFSKLIQEIESFKPNAEKFSFSVKKPQNNQVGNIGERMANGKQHAHQYQSSMNTFMESFSNVHESIKKNLSNIFLTSATRVVEQEEVKRFEKFKSNQIYTPVQPIEPQNQSIIAIDDDLEEFEKVVKNLDTNNSSTKKVQQPQPQQLQQPTKVPQPCQESQISISDILDNGQTKKVSNIPPPQPARTQKPAKQIADQLFIPQPPPQPPAPPPQPPQPPAQSLNQAQFKPIQPAGLPQPRQAQVAQLPPQSPIRNDDLQGEQETVLNVSQEQEFTMLTNGRDITKLLFLSKNVIAGAGGNQFQVFHAQTATRLHSLTAEAEITDIAYLEIDDVNGTLYVATKKGKLECYIKESNSESQFSFRTSTVQSVDRPGNLFLQVNSQEKVLYTLGDEKSIKQLSVKTLREIKKADIQDTATTFYVDGRTVFAGGMKFLMAWDTTTNQKKLLPGIDSKVVAIQSNENKIIVGLIDRIKVYEKFNGEYHATNIEQVFGLIYTMNILKKWPIVLVSCLQKQQPNIYLCNYEQDNNEHLHSNLATSCAVRETDKVFNVGFGKEKGACLIYRVEQTSSQSQQ